MPSSTEARADRRRAPRTIERLHTLLTIDEAARLLRVNRKTLYDAVKVNHVPGVVRVGRTIRISRDALLQWLRGNGGPALGAKS